MGAEQQVLDFILQPHTKAFDKGMRGMQGSVDRFAKAATDAFDIASTAKGTGRSVSDIIGELTQNRGQKVGLLQTGLAKMAERFPLVGKAAAKLTPILGKGLNLAISGLTKTVGAALDKWGTFAIEQEKFARATGMNKDETREFSAEIISASAKYGVSLDKVQSTANFMRKGMKGARGEVAKFAAEVSNFADLTDSGGEATQKLERILALKFKLGVNKAELALFGLRAIAKDTNIEVRELTEIFSEQEDFLRVHGKKSGILMLAQGAALVGALRGAKADVGEIEQVITALGNQQSKLMDHFRTSKGDIRGVVRQLGMIVSTMGPEGSMAREKALADWSDRLGLTRFVVESVGEAFVEFERKMEIFDKTIERPLPILRQELEDSIGPLKKLERTWHSVTSSMAGVFNKTMVPVLRYWADAADTILKGWKAIVGIIDEDKTFTPRTAEEKDTRVRRNQVTRANRLLATGKWSQQTYRSHIEQEGLQDEPGVKGAIAGLSDQGRKEQRERELAKHYANYTVGGGHQLVPNAASPGAGKDPQMATVAIMEEMVATGKEQLALTKRWIEIEEEKRRERRVRGAGGASTINPYAGSAAVEQGG